MSPLFADIRNFLIAATTHDNVDYPKFVLYSGHDTTIMPFLAALGTQEMFPGANWFYDGKWVPYASMILLELWAIDAAGGDGKREFAVRMLFQGKEVHIPGCYAALCPVSEFMKLTSFATNAHTQRHDQCLAVPMEDTEAPGGNGDGRAPNYGLPADMDVAVVVMVGTAALLGIFVGSLVTLLTTGKLCGRWACTHLLNVNCALINGRTLNLWWSGVVSQAVR